MKNMDDKIRVTLALMIAAGLFIFALGFHDAAEESQQDAVSASYTGAAYLTPEEEKSKYLICSQDDCHFTKEYAKPDNNCVAFFDSAGVWYELCGTYSIEKI